MATMFTGLDRVAKATGYPVEEVSGWEKRGHGGMHSCSTIIIHHTAGANNGQDYNSYRTVLNGRPGLPGPLAQFGVGRKTGKIYLFAAGVAYHAGKVGKTSHNNWNAIGIEIENNGVGEKYSDKTYKASVALAGELVREFKLKVSDVLGHKEVAVNSKGQLGRKIDPSFSMGKFREDVADYLAGKGDAKPVGTPEKPKPAPKPESKPKGKSVKTMADEVIAGKHGNGHENRRKSLGISAAEYQKVRDEVNKRAGVKAPAKPKGKSVSQMATEVIAGKHGNGHANRQKSLGISDAQYAKVRAEVNRRV